VTKKVVVILIVFVMAVALTAAAISASGHTETINMRLTGTIITIGDGMGLFDVNVKGSPGAASARGLTFSCPVDHTGLPPGTPCIDIPGSPDGLIIDSGGQITMIFNDGSMLFGNAADGGYVCFAPPLVYAPYKLAGGTGRYEGATGDINFDIETHSFGPPGSPVVPETGTVNGQIILP
jgi:hypothetical protein